MIDTRNPCKGHEFTRKVRIAQSKRVKEIVLEETLDENEDFLILGDFGDYPQTDEHGSSGLSELLDWNKVENVVDRLPEDERWTHYFKGWSMQSCNLPEAYKQLDYILISKSLAKKNRNEKPKIIRKGLPLRADRYKGPRFNGVGQTSPKSSDHCPVVIELTV